VTERKITNPGSALGEALGNQLEIHLHIITDCLCEKLDFHYLNQNPLPNKKKLLLYDNVGIGYNIDGVIANQRLQPIILLEYKYIRYKKHNRDKGSWLCTAHPKLRDRYETIRSSVAVLAGSWSKSSISMIRSHDINVFIIPFDYICEEFRKYDIDFDWGEKDRETAVKSWETWTHLAPKSQEEFGQSLTNPILHNYSKCLEEILTCDDEREIDKVFIQLITNLGERKGYHFDNIEKAIEFLIELDPTEIINVEEALSLLEPPPKY